MNTASRVFVQWPTKATAHHKDEEEEGFCKILPANMAGRDDTDA